MFAGVCRERSGQGRGDVRGGRRLCPAGAQARRGCRFRSDHGRLHYRDPVQASGRYSGRRDRRRGARLCRLGAARSRRLGDPAVAGAPGHHQHHDGGRAGLRRSVARQLDRPAAEPSARSDPRTVRTGARRRARIASAARDAEAKKRPPIRVRASVQPTFVRFVFEMPDGVSVSSVLNDQKLTLSFNAVLTFDLADAKIAAPPNIASINQKLEGETSAVEIALIGDVDVHSFREDKNYIVDVAFQPAEKPSAQLPVAGCSVTAAAAGGRDAGRRRAPAGAAETAAATASRARGRADDAPNQAAIQARCAGDAGEAAPRRRSSPQLKCRHRSQPPKQRQRWREAAKATAVEAEARRSRHAGDAKPRPRASPPASAVAPSRPSAAGRKCRSSRADRAKSMRRRPCRDGRAPCATAKACT